MSNRLERMPSTLSNVGTREGSVKPGTGPAPYLDGIENPEVDEPHDRCYRSAPVRTVQLSESVTEAAGGPLTRKNTPRLDLLAAARGAYVQQKTDENDSDALGFDTGAHSVRKAGTHVKSIQGHAEDVWRRIYKRPIPRGDPLEHEEFHRLYRRMQASLRRTNLLEDRGPAVEASDKQFQDQHGKRWGLAEGLTDAESGPESAEPLPLVQCTGPNMTGDSGDVWAHVERHVAREEKLHREFTHGITASKLSGPRWSADGRRFERRHARGGSDRPRYITVGRWRKEALGRPGRQKRAVRVPWIIAEIDGREEGRKNRDVSDRLARRLLRRLEDFGVDLSEVVVSYSGNASIHIRIPDGVVGCPIYRDAEAAGNTIARFFDRLCGADDTLRTAIDDACFRPGQLIRVIGSVHEKTGRQTVGTTADRFLDKPPCFLWRLSEPQFEYTPPEDHPLPRRTDFVPGLSALVITPRTPKPDGDTKLNVSQIKSRGGCEADPVPERIECGVREGEPWGPDVGKRYEGRNWAALFKSHEELGRCPTKHAAWTAVQLWNRQNKPPLNRKELRKTFCSAWRHQCGKLP